VSGLRVERLDDGRLARLTLDRPSRGNALDPPLLEALADAVRGLEAGGARAAVLAGAGGRAFSTGYDVEALLAGIGSGRAPDELERPLERALAAIDETRVPLVAAVEGAAYGAGCELACACDLRVAGASARFCFPPAKLGLVYSHTGIARLLALVGVAATKEMFMTGAPVDAARAERLGLASRVVADSAAEAESLALARALAANAPLSVGGAKAIVARLAAPRLAPEELRAIAGLREAAFRSADLAEGLAAFVEKRPPAWRGR
jgi:enoyl-CoA hydratase/carnithine racemase